MTSRNLAILLAITLLGGCVFVPKTYPRLEEARQLRDDTRADPRVARLASAELALAEETLERARVARATLEDPAVVDHLAYLAKQRLSIARMTAQLRSTQATAPGSTLPR